MFSRLTDKYRLLQHVAAFTIAWVSAWLLFVYVLRPITVPQPSPGYHADTLGKGETAVRNLLYLSSALRNGKVVVVLGSSELEQVLWNPYTPNLFFPRHRLARVLTYGKAGFETLGMYGLLNGVKPHLNPHSRLVIMLSPAWFRVTDLQTDSFAKHFNDNVLLQDYWNDEARSVFHDYLTAHQFEFANMTATQKMYMDDPSSILGGDLLEFLGRTTNARAYAQRVKLDIYLAGLTQHQTVASYDAGNSEDLPWDHYREEARAYEAAQMAHNDMWVRDGFYDHYRKAGRLAHRQYYPATMNPEPEMAALRELLQMLQLSKVKAMFVMQPVNPKLYDDMDRFLPVDARVAALCREYGMHYYDMYTQSYEEGILRDSSHPGQLGWEEIDHEIAEYFRL